MTMILFSSLFIFLLTLILCFLQKGKIERIIRIFAVGTFIIAVLLLFPLISYHNLLNDEKIPFSTIVLSVLQLGSLDGDYNLWITEAGNISLFYKIFLIVICYSMPLVFGGFILSFFEGITGTIRFYIFRNFRDVYYFSEINDNSLILAKSIAENKKALVVFFNCDDNNELKEEAVNHNFILLKTNYEKLLQKANRKLNFFMISKNEDSNLSDTLKIVNEYKQKFPGNTLFKNITIYLYCSNQIAEDLLNSTDKKGICIKLINEHQYAANELIFNHPLYGVPRWKEEKKLSVLVVGAGKTGRQIIKNIIWACQFGSKYDCEFHVIDKNAEMIKQILLHEAPEFFNPKWNIKLFFYEADAFDSSFEEVINRNCMYTDYVVVNLSSDDDSISAALFLRRYFLANKKNYEPFISVRVFDEQKSTSIKELTAVNKEKISLKGWGIYSQKSENYNLIPFGNKTSIYKYENIVENPIEQIALNTHSAYQKMFSPNLPEKEEVIKAFYQNEIDRKSNFANAIHIKYKLKMLGFDLKLKNQSTKEEMENAEQNLLLLKEKLSNKETLDYLGRLEHDRWLAFQISEGWKSISVNEAKEYSEKTGSHKHIRAKLHPCICTWEELDDVVKTFDPHLKEYDQEFVKYIPYILGLEESSINISEIKYILIKK